MNLSADQIRIMKVVTAPLMYAGLLDKMTGLEIKKLMLPTVNMILNEINNKVKSNFEDLVIGEIDETKI